jgi:hypothetical protein
LYAVAIIGFEQETYAVNEVAGSVTVCASVKEGSRHLEREVTVELSVQNGTAFGRFLLINGHIT